MPKNGMDSVNIGLFFTLVKWFFLGILLIVVYGRIEYINIE